MGKKKKKKKQQAPEAIREVVAKSNASPVDPAEKPEEEPPAESPPPAADSPMTEYKPDPVEEFSTTAEVSGEESAAGDSEKKENEEKQAEFLKISAVEETINRNIKTRSRLRRMLPDIITVTLALSVIGIGAAIWWKPPLLTASYPVTTYKYRKNPVREASLYRPLSMQERYYVKLPEKLDNRYEWFAIDRRREVVALTEEPNHFFLGKTAIRRADPLGLDLEFRKIDGHEWRINFLPDAIVFSNDLLCVRLDTRKVESK